VPGARAARVAHETMASERPALRFSGGERGARPQTRSRNLFVGLGQRRLDVSREKAHGKRTSRQARALDLEVRPGEVTAKTNGIVGRSLREGAATRTFTGRIARDMGGAQSRTRLRLLTHQGRTVNRMRDRLNKLTPKERFAAREMYALGVRGGPDGIRALERRLSQLDSDSPDAEAIRTILADPEAHLTERAGEVADELTALAGEGGVPRPAASGGNGAAPAPRRAGEAARVGARPERRRFVEKVRQIEEKTGAPG
jgi:hypothetical protein